MIHGRIYLTDKNLNFRANIVGIVTKASLDHAPLSIPVLIRPWTRSERSPSRPLHRSNPRTSPARSPTRSKSCTAEMASSSEAYSPRCPSVIIPCRSCVTVGSSKLPMLTSGVRSAALPRRRRRRPRPRTMRATNPHPARLPMPRWASKRTGVAPEVMGAPRDLTRRPKPTPRTWKSKPCTRGCLRTRKRCTSCCTIKSPS